MGKGTPPKVPRAYKLMQAYAKGVGAVRLAGNVKAIRLHVNQSAGRYTERQFQREVLPRLAYNNPQIPFHLSYIPRIPKATEAEASQPQGQAESSSTAKSRTDGLERGQQSATITIEYAEIPPRQIHLGDKSAAAVFQEIVALAKFTDEAMTNRGNTTRIAAESSVVPQGGEGAASVVREDALMAPEASETSLGSSAEGLADVGGVGELHLK